MPTITLHGMFNYALRSFFVAFLFLSGYGNSAQAAHIIGGGIYWECIASGPDAGKFIFYVDIYHDCAIPTTIAGAHMNVVNVPSMSGFIMNLVSQTDATASDCGLTCADQQPGISFEKYVFASDPILLTGTPPAEGYQFSFTSCCRASVNNLINAENNEIFYSATMYPYDGQDVFPCYDSSPQFAERPFSLICSGSDLRYNSNAIDPDLDSLSYAFADVLGSSGPITYALGYDVTSPLPGPGVDSTFDRITMDSVTGQIEYGSPEGVQGKWTIVAAVDAWRCGQRISRNIREMNVEMAICAELNNAPNVNAPIWTEPASATGFAVTVAAGDPISFKLTAFDDDLIGGLPQLLTFDAFGNQFGTDFTDPNSGCMNTPCATLTDASPPILATDTVTTTFNWQTTCEHITFQDQCASYSTTYNFLFKFSDDNCPSAASSTVAVSVTVLAQDVVESPTPRCVRVDSVGTVNIDWEPTADTNSDAFVEYAVFHATSPNGPYQQIGVESDISSDGFIHQLSNPVVAPSVIGANYYRIRTRSGCNGEALTAQVATVSSIHLSLVNSVSTADLSWTPVATPSLPSSNPNGYDVYREYPAEIWELIATTTDLFYSDSVHWSNEQVNYRVELSDDLPCVSVSNITGDVFNYVASVRERNRASVQIRPNPNNGTFIVAISGDKKIIGYELMDVSGRILRMENRMNPTNLLELHTELGAGIYLLRLRTAFGLSVRRIVVQ